MDIALWFVYGASNSDRAKAVARSLIKASEQNGWSYHRAQAVEQRDRSGRSLTLLDADSAQTLYAIAHRSRVAIISAVAARVLKDPSNTASQSISLATFVRYKAYYCNLVPRTVEEALADFREWLDQTDCDGPADPRCLPFHVFDSNLNANLNAKKARDLFSDRHRGRDGLVDNRNFAWKRAGARHGGSRLHVAGRDIGVGLHWDVSRPGSNGVSRITTANEVWQLRPQGYLNIHPDGAARPGNLSRRVWQAQRK